jgi:O-succinylbenzoic acid--CoA ligase
MDGYHEDTDASQQALRNGALYTGDLGYLDDEGDLWLVQRRSDLIVSGGENVYPAEVENALLAHPAVAEACVVGLPDAEWGQRVAAAVVLHPHAPASETDLTQHCRQHLAGYKIPRLYRFVGSLPVTASGKVERRKVIDLFATDE